MIRFIHCADIHFGRTIRTHGDLSANFLASMQQATYDSFKSIVDYALEKEVDFLLISGDVYDEEQRPLRGQWFLKKQAERLLEKDIPIYIIHGNHDPLVQNLHDSKMPENVHVFSPKFEIFSHTGKENDRIYLYGFSYPTKSFNENPAPLFVKKDDEQAFHIALLHGQERMQHDHEPYAPFSLSELKERNFDYWALGHIHKRQVLSEDPVIAYPGNIQGAHRKETEEKGAYYVEMTRGKTTLSFMETAPIQWEKPSFSIDSLATMEELLEKIEAYSFQLDPKKKYLLDIHIHGSGPLHERLIEAEQQWELVNLLQELLDSTHIFIDRLQIKTQPTFDRSKLQQQENLLGDVVRIVDRLKNDKKANEALQPVFSHPILRKYLTKFSDDELAEIIDEAEKRLLTPLISEVDRNEDF